MLQVSMIFSIKGLASFQSKQIRNPLHMKDRSLSLTIQQILVFHVAVNKGKSRQLQLHHTTSDRDENGRKRTEKPFSRFRIRILSSETGSGPE